MADEADYLVSAAYVDEMLKPIKAAGHFEALLAELGPRTSQMVLQPWSEPFHPAALTESLGEHIVKIAGEEFYAEMTYLTVKNKFGPILLPLMSTTVKKGSPAGFFSRLEGLVDAAIKGVTMRWDKKSELNGTLWVFYPRVVSPVVEHSWRGVIRFIYELTQRPGKVDAFQITAAGNALEYRLSWPAAEEPKPAPPAPPHKK
ncbi:MAG: hypothetical protein QM723_17115 [Myxococcaceae bacterium]